MKICKNDSTQSYESYDLRAIYTCTAGVQSNDYSDKGDLVVYDSGRNMEVVCWIHTLLSCYQELR